MRRKLITIATPDIQPFCKEMLENQRWYAGKQKFEFELVEKPYWTDLHPSFSKVWEINRTLEEGYDFLIWADADVAFMDSSNDLTQLLEPDYFMAAYQQMNWKTWAYLCNGLIVMRNIDQAKDYVTKWIQKIETGFIKDHPWEQWYFDELIRETNYSGVRACTAKEIGCFAKEVWHDGNIWEKGMPTVHFAGPTCWSTRQAAFLKHYQPLVK